MAKYVFMVTDGPDLGRTFVLESGVTLLGRLSEATPNDPEGSRRWTFLDKTVSRTHSEVAWHSSQPPTLIHLSQTNDTFIDGRRISEEILKPGQTVQMGQTTMLVAVEGAEGQATPRKKPIKLEAAPPNGKPAQKAPDSGKDSGSWGDWNSDESEPVAEWKEPTPTQEAMNFQQAPTKKLSILPPPDASLDFGSELFEPDNAQRPQRSEPDSKEPPSAAPDSDTLETDDGAPEPAQQASEHRLRYAEESDLAALFLLLLKSRKERAIDSDETRLREGLTHLVQDANQGRVFLVLVNDQPAGYLIVTFGFALWAGGPAAQLDDVYIEPEFRGLGLGTGAVMAAAAEAEELGFKAITLNLHGDLDKASAHYRNYGFEPLTNQPALLKYLSP